MLQTLRILQERVGQTTVRVIRRIRLHQDGGKFLENAEEEDGT
ncbi:MAG: hypothetical protein ABSA63_04980 [Thermoplasmata archaeon]|jgi:hypothetical protein